MIDIRLTIGLSSEAQGLLEKLTGGSTTQLNRIEAALVAVKRNVERIIMTDADFKKVLDQIDATTNTVAANTQAISNATKAVGDEVDALVTALGNAGVSQALVDQAQAVSAKLQTVSDAGASQVTVLEGIAAKGQAVSPTPPPLVVV